MPVISIIVPVYNAGAYFTTLLDSILAQTFKQFELILVLDCPTDGSDKVAKRYAQQDRRIVIIENEHNLHIGYSRNRGLEAARGSYIAFADHDDYVQPTWLEKLYNKAVETDADVVVSDIENTTFLGPSTSSGTENSVSSACCPSVTELVEVPDGANVPKANKVDYYAFPQVDGPALRQGMLQAMICSKYSLANTQSFDNANSIWNQLYKASLLKEHAILFRNNKILSYEDALFNIEVFACAKVVAGVQEALYVHITHQSNAFGGYDYKMPAKMTAYLQTLHRLAAQYGFEAAYLGESVLRKYYVSVFNEYRFKGMWSTISLLFQLRKHPFKESVKAYRKTKPTLSVAKKIFLCWLA